MSAKAFIVLIAAALVLGGVLAGAFIGGTVVGKGQAEAAQESPFPGVPVAPQSSQRAAGGDGPAQLSDSQQAEMMRTQLRAQFGQGGQGGAGAAAGAFGGVAAGGFGGAAAGGFGAFGGGLFGTITAVEDSKLTVETPGGEVTTVTLGDDTTVRQVAEIDADDLETGSRITVQGSRGEGGDLDAQAITVMPEGEGFPAFPGFGGGQGGGGQRFGGGQAGGGRARGQGGAP